MRTRDDEVREIFSLATTGDLRQESLPVEAGGLTLEELQRIGHEAGIAPASITLAAETLDARGIPSTVRRVVGLPIGLSRVVALPRAPTDREWEQLISYFRTTFDAHGRATTSGGLREWSHDSLHISVEPTTDSEQIRLSIKNDAVVVLNVLGAVTTGIALLASTVNAADGHPQKALVLLGIFGGIGVVSFATNLIRAPRWARERDRQLQEIAEHVVRLLADR